MTPSILQGPFLTRKEAARRAGVAASLIKRRPDLLRLGGGRLQEVYFAFQFDQAGVRPELGRVVQSLKADYDDIDICHWLVLPQRRLGLATPLQWLTSGGPGKAVLECAEGSALDAPTTATKQSVSPFVERPSAESVPRRRRRRHVLRRPAAVSGA